MATSFSAYEVTVNESRLICNARIKYVEYLKSYTKEENMTDPITEEEFSHIISLLLERGINCKEKATLLVPFKLNDWELIGYAFIINKIKNDEEKDKIVHICMIMPNNIGVSEEDVEHVLSALYPLLDNNSNINFKTK